MATEDYVVLRTVKPDPTTFEPTAGGLGGPTRSGGPTRGGEADPSVTAEVASLEAGEAAEVAQENDVAAVAPNMPLRLQDPMERNATAADHADITWGLKAVGADATSLDGSGVTVAVLDTGIDTDHPAFAGVDLETRNFTDDPDHDENGHGTHCAGTVFGQDVDGKRIGVARGVDKALIGKVLGRDGATAKNLVDAINWAVSGGATVISMSLGIDFPGFVERLIERHGFDAKVATNFALEGYLSNVKMYEALLDYLQNLPFQQTPLLVAASGNESDRAQGQPIVLNVAPPAAAEGIFSVGAVGQSEGGLRIADFSNTGPRAVGPGVAVTSSVPGGGLSAFNGTSMATPHVAGLAALWAQKLTATNGGFDVGQLRAKVEASASNSAMVAGTNAGDIGAGLVMAPAD